MVTRAFRVRRRADRISRVTGAQRIRLPLLLVLASLAAVAPVATDLYLPGLPALGDDLKADASSVQLTLTAFLLGMAVGQLVTGPLSDRYGRRRPLLVSATVCVLAGVATAVAPTLPILVAARLVQGLAGAGGMVIGRAVITDLVTGKAAARAFTLMITVGGIAPVLAPTVGGLLVGPLEWRGLLWTVTGLCVLMLVGVVLVVHETLPEHRQTTLLGGVRSVLARPAYRRPVAVLGCSFGVMMAYISASPFVYQNVLGLSAVEYGVAFGVNATGLIATGFVASKLVDVWPPRTMVRTGVAVQTVAALAFLALALTHASTWLYAVAIFVAVVCNGAVMGSSAALAMAQVRDVAGSGSAVLGFTQFTLGAIVAPLVGLGGEDSAVVPALVMAVAAVGGFTASRGLPQPLAGRGGTKSRHETPLEAGGPRPGVS
jgi:DHA1 family bicyclomycin/chloramphenicol resistance-like MFS transporter